MHRSAVFSEANVQLSSLMQIALILNFFTLAVIAITLCFVAWREVRICFLCASIAPPPTFFYPLTFFKQDRLILDLDSTQSLPDNPVQAGEHVVVVFYFFSHIFFSELMWNWFGDNISLDNRMEQHLRNRISILQSKHIRLHNWLFYLAVAAEVIFIGNCWCGDPFPPLAFFLPVVTVASAQPVWLYHLGPRRELLDLRELLRAVGVYVCGDGERNPPIPFSLATLTVTAVDVRRQRLFRQDRPRIHAHHVQDTASSVQHVRCSAFTSSPTQPCLIYLDRKSVV